MSANLTGIIGAMPEELEELLGVLGEVEEERKGAFTLYRGTLEGQEVLLAECGIGKVNAAALSQLFIIQEVTRIIFTGVAGAVDPTLKVGDIVVSTDALQHDLDVSALGYELGQVPGEPLAWQADERLRDLALEATKGLEEVQAISGRVVSGDQFIASAERVAQLRHDFDAACAEMEGAAIAQVCAKANIPFVIIRSISDTADHEAEVDFRAFTPLAAKRAKQVVREMLKALPK